jgi:hypothetical protein
MSNPFGSHAEIAEGIVRVACRIFDGGAHEPIASGNANRLRHGFWNSRCGSLNRDGDLS